MNAISSALVVHMGHAGLLPHPPHESHTMSHQYASAPGPWFAVHVLTLNLRNQPRHSPARMQGVQRRCIGQAFTAHCIHKHVALHMTVLSCVTCSFSWSLQFTASSCTRRNYYLAFRFTQHRKTTCCILHSFSFHVEMKMKNK